MRPLIALILALPLYSSVEFGWTFLLIVGLQILAGLDFRLNRD